MAKPPALVTVNFVAAHRGVGNEEVAILAETGQLRWVFNLSAGKGRNQMLRFWLAELQQPDLRKLPVREGISRIVGTEKQWLRGREIEWVLRISRVQTKYLCDDGHLSFKIVKHCRWISRASLVRFLERRLVA